MESKSQVIRLSRQMSRVALARCSRLIWLGLMSARYYLAHAYSTFIGSVRAIAALFTQLLGLPECIEAKARLKTSFCARAWGSRKSHGPPYFDYFAAIEMLRLADFPVLKEEALSSFASRDSE